MRELRVEDALLYLDQVKVEFGDRPHVYNEFLEIMKTFKTQQIDTPGVIRRVSTLFQGNRKLVLGFNTFLPEGYKIELPDGNGPPVATYRAPGDSVTHIITGPGATFFPIGPNGDPITAPALDEGPASREPEQNGDSSSSSSNAAAVGAAIAAASTPSQNGQLAHHRSSQAGTTTQQQQQRSPPPPPPGPNAHGRAAMGQFGGPHGPGKQQAYPFGQPPPYIHDASAPPSRQDKRLSRTVHPPPPPHILAQQQGKLVAHPRASPQHQQQVPVQTSSSQRAPLLQTQQVANNGHPPALGGAQFHASAAQPPAQSDQTAANGQTQPPMEFDHAINYVTTIKKRFAGEPETYKRFLEILHTYQKEQRGIKEVLDEVSVLFADHPDLLKQFTFFLPETVQAQAKEQLDQVAKEVEARKMAATSKQAIMHQAQDMRRNQLPQAPPPVPVVTEVREQVALPQVEIIPAQVPIPFGATMGRSILREREIFRNSVFGTISFAPVRPPRRNERTVKQAAAKNGRPTILPRLPIQPTTSEIVFFEKARKHLNRKELAPDKPHGSRRHTPYTEFLKCLHLFGAGILNKDELVLLLRGLFIQGHAPKSGANAGGGAMNPSIANDAHALIREFEELLIARGPYARQQAEQKDNSKYGSTRIEDFSFSDAERPTPSYVPCPDDYPKDLFISHTGQSKQDASVLNDKFICIGTKKRGCLSLEDYDGVRARRNAYEEAMFRIEDERFEMDMAIERNASAMRQAEPIAQEVTQLRETEEKDGQPIGRMQYKLKSRTFRSIQINAIGRIYGDVGDEIIEHLCRNPLATMHIVYQRLMQKDNEWRKVKLDSADRWRIAQEENYEGSFDQRCYFRRKEKESAFMSDVLLEECQDVKSFLNDGEKQKDTGAEFALACMDTTALMFQPHLSIQLNPQATSHYHAVRLVIQQVINRTQRNMADRERAGRIWAEFVVPFFDYPPEWVVDEVRASYRGKSSHNIVHFAKGQRVQTAYGEGTIIGFSRSMSDVDGHYKVKLGYGTASLQPSVILHNVPDPNGGKFIRKDGRMVRDDTLYSEDMGGVHLDDRFKVLFGSQNIYLFVRLFTMLVSMLDDLETVIRSTNYDKDPSELYHRPLRSKRPKSQGPKLSYTMMIASLKNVIAGKTDPKDFETLCRKLSKQRVHDMVALPKLVEKCVNAMIHVGKEDLLLTLHDYCQYPGMDPAQVRDYCLDVSRDASYRIQYDLEDGKLFFNYVPESEDMMTALPQGLASGGMDMMDVEDDDDDDDSLHVEDEEEDLRAVKRRKYGVN